jgi:hypothetical protein
LSKDELKNKFALGSEVASFMFFYRKKYKDRAESPTLVVMPKKRKPLQINARVSLGFYF